MLHIHRLHIFRASQPHYRNEHNAQYDQPIAKRKRKIPIAYAISNQLQVLRCWNENRVFFIVGKIRWMAMMTANWTHKPRYSVFQHQKQLNSTKMSRQIAYVFRKPIQRRPHTDICLKQ